MAIRKISVRSRVLPVSRLRRIDRICDRFDATLKAGKEFSPDDYLDQVAESERSKLKRELEAVEAAFRQPRAGDGRNFWGVEAAAQALNRLYFLDDVEHVHRVDRESCTSSRWPMARRASPTAAAISGGRSSNATGSPTEMARTSSSW